MKEIPVTGGHVALVDDEDYDFLSKFSWSSHKPRRSNTVYARRFVSKGAYELMHREVLKGESRVDHRDGNGLNNCRLNLRPCTQAQNMGNMEKVKSHSSRYKGVHFYKRLNKWMAYICPNYSKVHLGYFDSENDAASAYNHAAQQHFGEFAKLNQIA